MFFAIFLASRFKYPLHKKCYFRNTSNNNDIVNVWNLLYARCHCYEMALCKVYTWYRFHIFHYITPIVPFGTYKLKHYCVLIFIQTWLQDIAYHFKLKQRHIYYKFMEPRVLDRIICWKEIMATEYDSWLLQLC